MASPYGICNTNITYLPENLHCVVGTELMNYIEKKTCESYG